MAPRQVLMNVFFEQLLTFMQELSAMYPDDPDFSIGITYFRMMKSINPISIPTFMYESASAYDSEILTKNEKFFLDHSFGDDVDFNLLSKLKQYVKTMSPTSKEHVWTYIQNLYRLAKAIVG